MGVTEIASFLRVSRQRADQIVRTKGFPDPVAELAAGRVWPTVAVAEWAKHEGDRLLHHTRKTVPGSRFGDSPALLRVWQEARVRRVRGGGHDARVS